MSVSKTPTNQPQPMIHAAGVVHARETPIRDGEQCRADHPGERESGGKCQEVEHHRIEQRGAAAGQLSSASTGSLLSQRSLPCAASNCTPFLR